MFGRWKSIAIFTLAILLLGACGHGVGEENESIGHETQEIGYYEAIFSSAEGGRLFVSRQTENGVGLFVYDDEAGWSELVLPEALQAVPGLQITSVVETDADLLLNTRDHGTYQHLTGQDRWQVFAPPWIEEGRIVRVLQNEGRIFAFNEVIPNVINGIELWERSGPEWRFVRNDMFMIIDYMPRPTMLLRSTLYGTVEVSRDEGQSWQLVPGIFSQEGAPQLFAWEQAIVVATTAGVWMTRDDGNRWEYVSATGGKRAALRKNELILAGRDGTVSAVNLQNGVVRELPRLPSDVGLLGMAAAGDTLIATAGESVVFRLTDERWQGEDPAAISD